MKKIAWLTTCMVFAVSGVALAQEDKPKAPPMPVKKPALRAPGTVKLNKVKVSGKCGEKPKFEIDIENTHAKPMFVMVHYNGSGDKGQFSNLSANQKITFSQTPETAPPIACSETEKQCWEAWLSPSIDKSKGMTEAMVDGQKINFCAINKPNQAMMAAWSR
jgi:hypothetical protein